MTETPALLLINNHEGRLASRLSQLAVFLQLQYDFDKRHLIVLCADASFLCNYFMPKCLYGAYLQAIAQDEKALL